jgi:hypothetical protein
MPGTPKLICADASDKNVEHENGRLNSCGSETKKRESSNVAGSPGVTNRRIKNGNGKDRQTEKDEISGHKEVCYKSAISSLRLQT